MGPVVVDADTGEVIANYIIKSTRSSIPKGRHNVKFLLDDDGVATQDNAQEWVDNVVWEMGDDDDYVDLSDSGRFVKVFSNESVEFSVAEYEIYWNRLIKHLIYDMNVIYCVDGNRKRPACSQNDLRTICNVSRTTFYRFYVEAKRKKYVAKFETGFRKDDRYVINPKYALCGSYMPKYLYDLFNAELIVGDDYD